MNTMYMKSAKITVDFEKLFLMYFFISLNMSFWGQILLKVCECRCAEGCKSDRSRQELSNQSLVAKSGVDTAENEPRKVHLIFKLWDLFFVDPPCPLAISGPPQKRILQRRSLEDTASFVVY